jgi:peptidoglycan-associated lipoprotein
VGGLVIVFVVLGVVLFSDRSSTTAILLPDDDGRVGVITVVTKGDSRLLNQAFHAVTVRQGGSGLSEVVALDQAQVSRDHAALLAAQPARSYSFNLYFGTDSTELTDESKALIPQVVERIKAQGPTEVTIYGHTDTTGSEDANRLLGLDRANTVRQLLKAQMPALEVIEVRSLGSRDLLVPTAPNVDEPRNRRVEIFVL